MKRERRYMRLQDIGCICCIKEGFDVTPSDMHHLVDLGTRELSGGDKATIPLCPWHHRAVPPADGISYDEALYRFGPSLERNHKLFVKIYGTERQLLAECNRMIQQKETAA